VVGDILQPTHLLFILVIALLVLGPKRLPEVGRSLGRGLRDFRMAISGEDHEPQNEFVSQASVESAPAVGESAPLAGESAPPVGEPAPPVSEPAPPVSEPAPPVSEPAAAVSEPAATVGEPARPVG
jgi:TatA/E family protein of Tat protein translocase